MCSHPASLRRMPERVVNQSPPGKKGLPGAGAPVGPRLSCATIRRRRRIVRFGLVVVSLLALLGTSGCSTLFKDDYWEQIHAQSDKDELARIRDDPTPGFF